MSGASNAAIEKVRKLLALARDARGNEHEAANAAAMAQRLMTDLGIEMAMVDTAGASKPGHVLGGERERKKHSASAMYTYQRDLMSVIARNHFLHWAIVQETAESFGKVRRVNRHQLLGRKANIVAATMLYDYLIETMDRLLPYTGMEKRGREALLWLSGCSERLQDRLHTMRREQERETAAKATEERARAAHPGAAPGNALVTLAEVFSSEEDFNLDFAQGLPAGTTARKRKEQDARWAAFAEERKTRKDALLSQGIEEGVVDLMLYGYSEEQARERLAETNKPLTEATKRRQREAEERREQRWREQSDRRWRKDQERRQDPAFRAGAATGDNIGLDTQVGRSKHKEVT